LVLRRVGSFHPLSLLIRLRRDIVFKFINA
jgi:hypothetical protein